MLFLGGRIKRNQARYALPGCIKMLSAAVVVLFIAANLEVTGLPLCDEPIDIVNNFSVAPFVDEKRNIRLNISWREPNDHTNIMDVTVENNGQCKQSFTYDLPEIATNVSEIIVPSLDLTRPADTIEHCSYNVTFKEINSSKSCENYQIETYTVPECVERVCRCQNSSPFNVSSIVPVSANYYEIKWERLNSTGYANNTIDLIEVSYKTRNKSSYIRSEVKMDENNGISLPGLQKGEEYEVYFRFFVGDCLYSAYSEFYVPTEKINLYIIALAAVVVCFCIYLLYSRSTKVLGKLRKYFPFLPSVADDEKVELNYVLFNHTPKIKEEYNAQYTPLEFILKAHEYDHYELPRNKIILKKEIGKGAFGKVFLAKAFDLKGESDWKMVAVKQLRDDAPDDEIRDFELEIKILKQIEDGGGHKNVVKLLACVTMEQPFMMVMELVPHGALKEYLRKLRAEWQVRRKVSQHFFPHDMKEDWLPNGTAKNPQIPNGSTLKYATCIFENDSGSSYIVPNIPPSSKKPYSSRGLTSVTVDGPKNFRKLSGSPSTPASATSSQLPATPDTLVTNIDESPRPSLEPEFGTYPKPALDHTELQEFAFQIANGMAFLEKIPIVHRDLAARNILITSDKQLKISDFGMSRTGPYINRKQRRQPLRWMAIEAIETRSCDTKTDVWSFGVVLWEIGTLGGFPYENTSDAAVLPKLKRGERLPRPEICSDELYEVMRRCWSEDAAARPTFRQLVDVLDVGKRRVYVDFDRISPDYAFPPSEEAVGRSDAGDRPRT